MQRSRVRSLLARGQPLTDEEADLLLHSPAGEHVKQMLKYAAVGTRDVVHAAVAAFAHHACADELITVHPAPSLDARLRSLELLAENAERACA